MGRPPRSAADPLIGRLTVPGSADPVLLPAWRARPWLSRLKEYFARLWEYWL